MLHKKISLLNVSALLFYVLVYIEDTLPYGQIWTLSSLILMLLACLGSNHGKLMLPKSGYLCYLVLFFLFCVASMLWAESTTRTFIIVRGMFIIVIEMTIAYICLHKRTSTDTFLRIIMDGGYIVVFYCLFRYGWSNLLLSLQEDIRLSNEIINANSLGMCAAYSIVINFYYIVYQRISFHDLLMVPSLIMIAASGSRKAIIIVAAGVLFIVMMKNLKNKRFVSSLLKALPAVAVLIGITVLVLSLPAFSLMRTRLVDMWSILTGTAERGTSGYIRMIYNQIGWELFKEHPVLGIGLNNANRYITQYYGHAHLHNNMIELLACGGILGFLLHYSIYAYLFVSYWKLRERRCEEYDICLVLLVIRFVMGYGHIQYYQLLTYFYLMVFYLLISRLKKQDTDLTVSIK